MYVRAGSVTSVIVINLFDVENIFFDASLVMYINRTSIPPTMIINRVYENQVHLIVVMIIYKLIVIVILLVILQNNKNARYIC